MFLQYQIRGHSGEGFNFKMMKNENASKNEKQKLDILKVRVKVDM